MSENIETADGGSVEPADVGSVVYKYTGPTDGTDVVAAVKSYHADGEDCSPGDLVGRTIASGGRETESTYVVIVEWGA